MACIRVNGQIDLDLPGHVPAQVHLTKSFGFVGEVKDHCTSQFVVSLARSIGRFEDVDAVPLAGVLAAWRYPCS